MGLLQESDAAGGGFLKAGFLGFAGSGKTYTATMLAIGTRAHFGHPGPIAFFDTENGSPFVVAEIAAATGKRPLVVKSRSLDDLKATVQECIDLGVSVLIVDSITHVWKEVCETYLRELNSKRKLMRKPEYEKLEFQHWSAIKSSEMWGGWTDLYLNAPLHVIICGRAGYEYDFVENAQGKSELRKVGVKMRVEGEFGFEPSLLVEMSSEQVMVGDEVAGITHRAFVLKDRTMDAARSLVGKSADNPDWSFFASHVEALSPDTHSGVDTSRASAIHIVEGENTDFVMEMRARDVILEEVTGELEAAGFAGTSGDARKARAELVLEAFGTYSQEKLKRTPSAALADGFKVLQGLIAARSAGKAS
jgi:hypothetical protein